MKTVLFILLLIFPAIIHAQDFNHPTVKTFTAKVSSVRLSADLLEKGKRMDDVVSVKASAIIFPKPLKISDVRKAKPLGQPAIDTLARYFKACTDGSPQLLSKFWVGGERKEILAMLDADFLRQTHEQFKNDPSLTIVGLVFEGEQTAVLLRGTFAPPEYVTTVSVQQADGGFFLTNKPRNDLELAIIEASFYQKSKPKHGR